MEQENNEREHAKEVKITITSVEVRTNPHNSEEVSKVLFETDKGRISYKPKTQESKFQDGLKVTSTRQIKLTELNQIIRDIGTQIAQKGNVIVKASFNLWNTTVENQDVTYRYVQGQTMMDSWKIEGNKEEKVVA